ncbi:MAG: hypothetical protein ACPGRX_06630 [Bdellovibrionales bacterium]
MAQFDFIEAASFGYRMTWDKRAVLARLGLTPFLVKLGSFAVIPFLGLEDNFLRQGLVLLPSYFAEGFFLAYIVSLVWSGPGLTTDFEAGRPYARNIMAASVLYVLTKLLIALFAGSVLTGVMQQAGTPPQSVALPPTAFLSVIAMFAFFIWAFRLLWLYIPVAMGGSMQGVLKRFHRYVYSFPMIGCWLLCFVPIGLLVMAMFDMLAGVFGHSAEAPSSAFKLVFTVVQAFAELVIAVIATLAMAHGIDTFMKEKDDIK